MVHRFAGEIAHQPTLRADEVVVPIHVGVVPPPAGEDLGLADQALLFQRRQRAVHGIA